MKIEKDEITIRDFTETDLPLMFKWLTDTRVLEYYEGRDVRFTMDTLSAHFLEEIPDGFRMIIEYKKFPIGYAQAVAMPVRFVGFINADHRWSPPPAGQNESASEETLNGSYSSRQPGICYSVRFLFSSVKK